MFIVSLFYNSIPSFWGKWSNKSLPLWTELKTLLWLIPMKIAILAQAQPVSSTAMYANNALALQNFFDLCG